MKKLILLLAMAISGLNLNAQEIQIGGMFGYYFGGGLYGIYGETKLIAEWAPQFFLSVSPNSELSVEFNYSNQSTQMRVEEYGFDGFKTTVNVNQVYYNLHFLREVHVNDNFRAFPMAGVGLSELNFESNAIDDDYRMAVTFGGGLKYLLGDSKKLGIRMQARMIMPVYFAGTSFWLGTGGSGAALTAGAVMIQGEASAGLFLNLGSQ